MITPAELPRRVETLFLQSTAAATTPLATEVRFPAMGIVRLWIQDEELARWEELFVSARGDAGGSG